ncbi:Putative molybdenum cofactor sulfurase, pyruvate kinase-like, insert domain superfamily [Septoria linicola]|uniref:Molybdenum cofactor sulfurase, pyruvate kinase-like, insert domain superfamily n=1 Tax=Septoria linicola TaxID=215465 RepID=A0A9Q9ATD6_9PEZI|nr:Putative molybdenum cofactor sulfurase, pyruvate kinase-like, insert domain superfamily [Septoria linicola]
MATAGTDIVTTGNDSLEGSALYIYPIKSLRGISLRHALLTPQGLAHDRRFMLREVQADVTRRNMACYHDPIMVRFIPTFAASDGSSVVSDLDADSFSVKFLPIDGSDEKEILIPLVPDTSALQHAEIAMHGSATMGYNMGGRYNQWFSECFGKKVELIYVGTNRRKAFGNLSPNTTLPSSTGIEATLSNAFFRAVGGSGDQENQTSEHEQGLGLSDVAAVLVVNETSLNHVTETLPTGLKGHITKFRPNIVVSGARDEFVEDFWREITIRGQRVLLTQNCNRCVSLNLDFDNGGFAEGEAGKVVARLSKTRRVDPGAKYSPVFGRYGFPDKEAHGKTVSVGDVVVVTSRNEERTQFYWPFKVPL